MNRYLTSRILTAVLIAGSMIPSGVAGYRVLAQRDIQEEIVPMVPTPTPQTTPMPVEDEDEQGVTSSVTQVSPTPRASASPTAQMEGTQQSSSLPKASGSPVASGSSVDREDEDEDEMMSLRMSGKMR